MANKKIVPIKYTSRDFKTIKEDLVDHAKRYYPDNYNDFSSVAFGSLVLDSVSYGCDILSYYLDYQVNESFIDTSIEFDNIRKHAKSLGYSFFGRPIAFGTVSLFVLVPANANGTAPDTAYYPTVKRGTEFSSANGANFILTEDVRFDDPINEVVAARFNVTTGATTYFAIRAYGQVSSGKYAISTANLNDSGFQRFRRVRIGGPEVSDVISVKDSNGNQYYQVDYLSQEVVYLETTNQNAAADGVRNILKPYVAARRFILDQDDTGTYLQFGFGSEDDDTTGIVEPSRVAIQMHGKRYISSRSFDPSQLLKTNKLGLSPNGTTLNIVYRFNDAITNSVPVNSLNTVIGRIVEFTNTDSLNNSMKQDVASSLEVSNPEPISAGTTGVTNEELKIRSKNYYATQNRAVTKQDYETICYKMPAKFGTIKRINMVNDPSATNRRLSLYVISENANGKLVTTNSTIKSNLKFWMQDYKMLNDVIDILDTKIINFGIDFEISVTRTSDPTDVINRVKSRILNDYDLQFYIGEPIYVSQLFSVINKVEGVADVIKVKVFNKSGGIYSASSVPFKQLVSRDGTFYKAPGNAIFELKYPNSDIRGVAR